MAGRIFINYRRGDDPGYTQALFHRLESEFGRDALFMDVEGYIKAGDDFAEVLDAQVAQSDVLLVVIGPRWADAEDETGRRRLDNPEDFVRIEIAAALEQKKRVIPVLVNNAAVPRADELPDPLKPLARRNAVRLTHDRFRTDVQGLIDELRNVLGQSGSGERSQTTDSGTAQSFLKRFPFVAFALLGAAAGAAGYGVSGGFQVNLAGAARAIQLLPAISIGLAVAVAIAVCGAASPARALLAGALAGVAWLLSDCAVIYGPLFTDAEWNGGLTALKQFVWGAANGLALLVAVALVVPAARSIPVWPATILASAVTAMLFGSVDAFAGSPAIPGAIQDATTMAALSFAFWPTTNRSA